MEKLTHKLRQRLEKINVGNSLEKNNNVGAMTSAGLVEAISHVVDEARQEGAQVGGGWVDEARQKGAQVGDGCVDEARQKRAQMGGG